MSSLDDEARTAIQNLIAQTLSRAATSRGYRLREEREPLAAAVVALFATSFEHGVQLTPAEADGPAEPPVVLDADDREHAMALSRYFDPGVGTVVRRLSLRLAGQVWEQDPGVSA